MKRYATVSLPRRLCDDIARFIEEVGYWTSVGSFVREAAIDKLYAERAKWKAISEDAEG